MMAEGSSAVDLSNIKVVKKLGGTIEDTGPLGLAYAASLVFGFAYMAESTQATVIPA